MWRRPQVSLQRLQVRLEIAVVFNFADIGKK